MEVSTIFVIVNESLLSVKYDKYDSDELSRIMNLWNDPIYLFDYFNEHKTDLFNGFLGNIAIEEAIATTIDEANELEQILYEIANSGKSDKTNNLQTLFKPLDNNEFNIPLHQKSKLKGFSKKSWLRIYAIRISANMYVIAGAAIKLNRRMNDREHLKLELEKLELTKKFLKVCGLLDETDYDFVEL